MALDFGKYLASFYVLLHFRKMDSFKFIRYDGTTHRPTVCEGPAHIYGVFT